MLKGLGPHASRDILPSLLAGEDVSKKSAGRENRVWHPQGYKNCAQTVETLRQKAVHDPPHSTHVACRELPGAAVSHILYQPHPPYSPALSTRFARLESQNNRGGRKVLPIFHKAYYHNYYLYK